MIHNSEIIQSPGFIESTQETSPPSGCCSSTKSKLQRPLGRKTQELPVGKCRRKWFSPSGWRQRDWTRGRPTPLSALRRSHIHVKIRKSAGKEKENEKSVLCDSESRVSGRNHESSQRPIRRVQRSAGRGRGEGEVEITRTAGECFTCFYSLFFIVIIAMEK